MIRVVKRNGRVEALDVSKIQKYTSAAVEGLEGVSQSELEIDAKLQFIDMISTQEIQETLIKTAVNKIDVDRPNWTFVAARLFLYDIYHKVSGFTGYIHLREYFERGEQEGRILPGLKDKYDLDDLNDYIKPERDLQFTYLGIRTLYDRYLLKDRDGNPIELPQHLFMAVAMFLAQNEFDSQGWAKKFYDILSKFEVMAATPTLSNARTTRHQLSSCFLRGTLVRGLDRELAIEEIKEGDYVLTHTKEFKRVTETFKREYEGKLITLKVNGLLRDIKATIEHPILSIKSEDISCSRRLSTCLFNQGVSKYCYSLAGEYKDDCSKLNIDLTKAINWREIKDLEKDDFVSISFSKYTHNKDEILISDFVTLKNLIFDEEYIFFKRANCSFINYRGFINEQIKRVKNRIKLDRELFLLIGYYLAEGHISRDRDTLVFTFGSKESYFINETKALIYSIFGIEATVKKNSDNSTNVIVNSKIVASFIYELLGSGFNKKRLSPILKYAKSDAQIEMLIGAFRGDGCAISEGYQLTLSNKELIEELFEVALRCGLSPYMFKGNKSHLANYHPYYLKIGVRDDREFILKVNKNIEKINLNLDENSKTKLRYFWLDNRYFMRIEEVKEESIRDTVYNIEVEDDHSYSVNLIDVHNCYIGSTPDNIEGIFDAYKEMALLSKFGGGIGWDWTQVRGMGSYIDGHKHAAGGIIPFLKITNDIAIAVDQLGCVAKGSYVRVLKSVKTDKFEHDFRREYSPRLASTREEMMGVASYASKFAFEYGKYSKNFISSLIYDYVMGTPKDILQTTYKLSKDQYKRIIGVYKKINKGIPEGFKEISGFEKYLINRDGVVINRVTLKKLSYRLNRKGYVVVSLNKNSLPLHRLLAKEFIEDFRDDLTVDHIDGNKLNNTLDNLQLISNQENISKGWNSTKDKRIEMARVKKYLTMGYRLKGERRETKDINIQEIKVISIPIEKVRVGDIVESYNIEENSVEFKPVLSTFVVEVKRENQKELIFSDGNSIVTSAWHPFPIFRDGKLTYIRTDEVRVGDRSINHKNEIIDILEIRDSNRDEEFYDLTVKDNNNYFCSSSSKKGNYHLIHNTRKGAIAVYIEPWHIDIREFLDLKKNSGEERRRAHDLFPALWINDLFMKRVQEDSTWTLFDPYEVKELSELYGEEFERRYIELESDDSVTKEVVSAKQLWKEVLRSYFETGNPFLTFKDSANRANPNRHKGIIRSSNLCVTGDTRLATQFGLVKASELEKMAKDIIATYDYRTDGKRDAFGVGYAQCIKMYKTKESAEVYEIKTKDGYSIKATPWHEFYVLRDGNIIKIPLRELKLEDKLLIQSAKGQFGKEGSYSLGLLSGFIAGDGTLSKNHSNQQVAHIDLYNEEIELKEFILENLKEAIKEYDELDGSIKKDEPTMPKEFNHTPNSKKIRFSSVRLGRVLKERYNFTKENKLRVPEFIFRGKEESVKGYLQGLFTSDATINILKNDGIPTFAIELPSISKELLKDIQILLSNFGIRAKISKMRDGGDIHFKYKDKEYLSKELYRLNINGHNAINFIEDIGFLGVKQAKAYRVLKEREELGYPPKGRKKEYFEVEIESIEQIGNEDVYDTTQLVNHSLIFNGIVTGNCTEIFQNTSPNHYKIKVVFDDGSISLYEEDEIVTVDSGISKPAKKITALDTIDSKSIYIVEKESIDGETAVCNLASINLSKINTKEDIARVVPIAIRMLDNVIDLNFYPLAKVKKTNSKSRAIGLGVMGEAQMLAEAKIKWGSNEHLHKIDEIMESISYYAIKSSSDLALEKGVYPNFKGSDWSKGIFPIDKANKEACKLVDRGGVFGYTHDWLSLKEKVKRDGMRNGYLMAIAPTSSISILTGTTQAIEPVYKRKWYEENLSGMIPVVVPNLNIDTWQYYTPSYELDQRVLVRAAAIRQKWIDQGQSLNIFIRLDKASGRYLNEIYMEAWKFGLKSTYYLRSQSPEAVEADEGVEDRSLECAGCQ